MNIGEVVLEMTWLDTRQIQGLLHNRIAKISLSGQKMARNIYIYIYMCKISDQFSASKYILKVSGKQYKW
jgi:hypothetical protein